MASVIDVKTLSKNEILHLIQDLLNEKIITPELLAELAEKEHNLDSKEDMAFIESLVNKHFEEYDEVFRKLA